MLNERLPRWIQMNQGDNGLYALVEQQDYERVQKFKWFIKEGFNTQYARSQYQLNNRKIPLVLHRFIMNAKPGELVDHINRNGLDCRRSNLRIVPRYVNHINVKRKIPSNTGFRGVHKRGSAYLNKPFTASIQCQKKLYHIGYFATAEEAARAYDKKALELHGEYAMLNFPK